MAKKISMSQYKSKMRQLERKQKHAVNQINRDIQKYNREVKKAVNDYNLAVRKYNTAARHYNADVRRSRRIINQELRKLNSSTSVHNSYIISTIVMQQSYEAVGKVYFEGVTVSAEQQSILDLIEHEQANSIVTANCVDGDSHVEEAPNDLEIGNQLALISEDLNNRWKGAVFSLNPNNPDATRHFCTSTREIFTEFLEIKAPDEEVFAYNPQCVKTEKGNASRREKIKYMMRYVDMDDSVIDFVEEDIKNILELNQLLSGGTHGPAGKFSFAKLLQVKKRVEQGIVFLCEISKQS